MTTFYARAAKIKWQGVKVYFAATLIAIFVGALTGMGMYSVVAPLALIVPVVYFLVRPDISLVFLVAMTLIAAGSLRYFFGLGQFQWGLSVLGTVLLGYALIGRLFSAKGAKSSAEGLSLLMLLWWIILIYSSAVNAVPALDWLVGIRIYLPVVGVFAFIAFCRPSEGILRTILKSMMAIAAIQWIFCLYQKLYVVPLRIASHYPGSPWDSIVGTFGGDKFGGGESGSLGVYLSIIMVLAVALTKYRQLSMTDFSALLIACFTAMVLVESKVIVLMVPLGIFIVYRGYFYKYPAKFLVGMLTTLVLMFSLLVAYYYLYWQTDNQKPLFDALFDRLWYSFDPKFQASTTNLGRVKSLIFWWDRHSILDSPLAFFLGHGLASAVSSSSIIGEGTAVRSFNVMLDVTGASKLLWESGVLGLLVFLFVFVLGFVRAKSLKTNASIPVWHRAAMSGVEAAMVLLPLSIFYEVTVVSSPPMQFTAMFLLGYVVYWRRETSGLRNG